MVHLLAEEKRAPKASDRADLLDLVSRVMQEQREAYETRIVSLRTNTDRRDLDFVMRRFIM